MRRVRRYSNHKIAGLTASLIVSWSPVASAQVNDDAGATDASPPVKDEPIHDDLRDLELLDLDVPIVVTAARREQKLATVPYAMSVITAKDIRRSGARSVPDALRLVPGVDVADLSYANAAVSPRGLHGFLTREVLVLVDGRQIFDSLFGGTVWGSWPFQLEDIKRIEVICGPGGVTWGANAVNGVINIITKDPADQLGLTLTAGGGSRGTAKTHVGYARQDGALRYRVSTEYESSDGFRKGGSILGNLDDDYKAGRLALHAVYDKAPGDVLTFSAGSGGVDGAFSPTPLAGIGTRRNPGSQASFLMGTWSRTNAAGDTVQWTAYVNDFYGSPGATTIDYRYQQIALQFSHTVTLADVHTLVWGVDHRVDLLDTSNADPFMLTKDFVSTAVIGAYVQDRWRLADKVILDLGGRIDYESYGGFEPSARAALSYELSDDAFLYGAVSRAFQMPPAGYWFLDIPLLNDLARAHGRRTLKPETVVAYEIGYRGKWLDRIETSLNLFWHEYDEVTTLSPRLGPPALICMDIDNRAQASIYGAEVDTRFAATKNLTFLGHYTFQEMNWRSSVPFHDKDDMSPPEHQFMLGARYSATEDLHLSSHLYYVDAVKAPNPANPFVPRDVDAYFRLDLNTEYEFWNDGASIAVGVRNLLDPNHYEGGTMFLNDAEVPRMVYAEFRMHIK